MKSFFYSISNFIVGKAMVSGSGSDIPFSQDIVFINAEACLSNATLRFSSLAEKCQTQKFYLKCFKLGL